MLGLILELMICRVRLSPKLVSLIVTLLNFIYRKKHNRNLLDNEEKVRFFSLLNHQVHSSSIPSASKEIKSLSIHIIATEKDFHLLKLVISFALRATRSFNVTLVNLIIPSQFLDHESITSLYQNNHLIRVIEEESIFNVDEMKSLFAMKFVGRENWCLQQLLKYYSVLNSKTDYALVLDADTIILREIPELGPKGETFLMPTLEYNADYYKVLISLGIIEDWPPNSFVPHHMIYSVSDFHVMHHHLNEPLPNQLANQAMEVARQGSVSPFSLDYELYAQFMMRHKRDRVLLFRWANCRISPHSFAKLEHHLPRFLPILKLFFNSLSIHSWINE
jgi:hypothetical protein